MDTLSQFSVDSATSADSKDPVYIAAGDIRKRLSESIAAPKTSFQVRAQFGVPLEMKLEPQCVCQALRVNQNETGATSYEMMKPVRDLVTELHFGPCFHAKR